VDGGYSGGAVLPLEGYFEAGVHGICPNLRLQKPNISLTLIINNRDDAVCTCIVVGLTVFLHNVHREFLI